MVKVQPSVLQLSETNLEQTVKLLHDRLGVTTKESLKVSNYKNALIRCVADCILRTFLTLAMSIRGIHQPRNEAMNLILI